MATPKIDHYSNDNLKFRRAFLSERLGDLKVERQSLIAEREEIEAQLGVTKNAMPSDREADQTTT